MAVPLGLDSPLKQSIFAAYVFLWVASALLVYASKQSGAPPYNATSVVVLTELAKLGLALALYRYYDGTWLQLGRGTVAAWRLLLKYMVPAGLYAVYNNLMYINLTNFDPGTYTLMMQLRILFTGLLYQALFARCAARRASDPRAASAAHGPRRLLTHAIHSRRSTLNRNQWVALVLIAFGCIAKEAPKLYADTGSATLLASNTGTLRAPPPPHAAAAVSHASSDAPSAAAAKLEADVAAWLLLAAQMLCSICAGKRWAARAAAAPPFARVPPITHPSLRSPPRSAITPKPHGPPASLTRPLSRYRRPLQRAAAQERPGRQRPEGVDKPSERVHVHRVDPVAAVIPTADSY